MAVSNSHIAILTLINKWTKCTNQKTQTGKLDKKTKPISVLYPGNPSHIQGYTKAQNKGMEEDLPRKWRTKKSRSCNSHL